MGLKLKTTEWVKDSRSGQLVVGKLHPTSILGMQGQSDVHLQGGRMYYADGTEITEPPQWVKDQMLLLGPARLRQLGWMEAEKSESSSPSLELVTEESEASTGPETNPYKMRWYALKAWAKREHGVEGKDREEILHLLQLAGAIEPE